MERQLDAAAGYLLQKATGGARHRCADRRPTRRRSWAGRTGRGVLLEDGTHPARRSRRHGGRHPSRTLRSARNAGLDGRPRHRGRRPDAHQRSATIFAVGECVEHRGQCYGLVAPLYDLAKVVAARLMDDPAPRYEGSVTSTKLKVTGVDLFSAGDFADGAGPRGHRVARRRARRLQAAGPARTTSWSARCMYGDTADGTWFFDLMKNGADVTDMRDTLIFGPAFAGGAPRTLTAAVAALPPDAEICGCNGVCKGNDRRRPSAAKGLTDLDAVRAHTKASASCGIVHRAGGTAAGADAGRRLPAKAAIEPMCKCTDLTP